MAQNFTIKRGDTVVLSLAVTQSGSAYNLTGASIRMTAKYDPADLDAAKVFTLTVGSGITVTSAPAGTATVTIGASNTSSLPAARVNLYYDIQVTDSFSRVFTIVDGILTVDPDISITTP